MARLAELMQYRRVNNEFDAVMELIRPDIHTSKKTIIKDGKQQLIHTPYKELASKALGTGNFTDETLKYIDEVSIIALSLQAITESSDGLLDLTDAHNFFADLQGITTQASKSYKGKFAELVRTNIQETRRDYSSLSKFYEKSKMKPMPMENTITG